MNRDQDDIVKHLYDILGPVVILPIPKGEKGPKFQGWNNTTWEQTQTEEYQQWIKNAVSRGGNLGILLGENSGHLVTLDFDDDDEIELFWEACPWARETMKSRGRHYQLWFIIDDGNYPAKRVILKKVKDRPTVEFRGGGGLQSVVWGEHPDKMRYEISGTPMHISYAQLADWISVMQGYADAGDPRKHDYGQLSKYKGLDIRNLDLLSLLRDAEIYPKQVDQETYAIRCPWVSEHSTKSGVRDAAVWQYPIGSRFPAFRCLHAHCVDRWLLDLLDWLEEQIPGIVKKHCRPSRRGKSLESCVVVHQRIKEEPKLPIQLIEGLLYEKTKMMIVGPPKMRKSWLAADLALCLCLGEAWMGFDTCQTRVLFLNMEMQASFMDWRLYMIEEAREVDSVPNGGFTILNLRGSSALDEDWDELAKFCIKYGPFGAIFIDPIYKVLGERDENSAKDMAKLLRNVDMVAEISGAAVIEIHHTAKGDASLRDVGDRASGSGVFFRDPDAFMSVGYADPKAKNYNEGRLDFRARLVPIIEPFGIRWGGFRWQRDESVNIDRKAGAGPEERGGKPPRQTQGDILLQILRDNPDGLTHTEWKEIARVTFSIQASSFNYALKNIENKIVLDGKKYKIRPENT